MKYKLYTPQSRFYLVLFLSLIFMGISIFLALKQKIPLNKIEVGTKVHLENETLILKDLDFIQEPGEIADNQKLNEFYSRQGKISNALKIGGEMRSRKFSDLPFDFWIQILVGLGAILITSAIWVFNSRNPANLFFLISGIATVLFTNSAAIYTTRAMPLETNLFKLLSILNASGASLYGMATLAIFFVYPKKIPFFKYLILLNFLFFSLWTVLACLQLLPPTLNVNAVTFFEMLVIITMITYQWFLSRKDPESKASLYWVGSAFLIGAGAFIFLNALPLMLGQKAWINQSVGFTFFLLIYLGIAAGLLKYRLFDVGKWSLQVVFHFLILIFTLLLDALFLLLFDMRNISAFGLSIVSMGFIYIPLKNFIWKKVQKHKELEASELFDLVLKITLSQNKNIRLEKWINFLDALFSPLEIIKLEKEAPLELTNNGAVLNIPAVFEKIVIQLRFPHRGTKLFTSQDVKMLEHILQLLENAERSRDSYDKGVVSERKRIAQDLHDDIGSQLLTGIHLSDGPSEGIFREALQTMQAMISDLSQEKISLEEILSILRYETINRLSLTGVEVNWPVHDGYLEKFQLRYLQHKTLTSSIREIVSNVIKHSGSHSLHVEYKLRGNIFTINFRDDGMGLTENKEKLGSGISGLKKRMLKIGGECHINSTPSQGTVIQLIFKLDPGESPSELLQHD